MVQLSGRPVAQSEVPLGEHHDGSALRGLVGAGWRAVRRRRAAGASTPLSGRNSTASRLPSVIVPVLSSSRVFTSPAASTARPDIASTLRCTSRSMPAMPIALSRAPMVVGIRQTSSDDQHDPGLRCTAEGRQRLQGHHRQHEHDRQAGEQDVEGDLVGGLLPGGALDEGDHPVQEGLPGLGRDPDDDPVREHPGAAGDGRPVAAGLADHRCGLAGDRRLVDAGDALHDVAVAGDHVAGLADDPVVRPSGRRAGRGLLDPVDQEPGGGLLPAAPQRGRLGLAAALGDGLGQVGEHRPWPTATPRSARRRSRGGRRRARWTAPLRPRPRTSPGCASSCAGRAWRTPPAAGSPASGGRAARRRPGGAPGRRGPGVTVWVVIG